MVEDFNVYNKPYLAGMLAMSLMPGAAFAEDKVLTFLAEHGPAVVGPVIAAFEAENPGVKVQMERVPFADLAAAIEARIGGGDTKIDIIAADTPRVPFMAKSGQIKPLDEALAETIKKTIPNATEIESVSYEGKLHSYPLWSSTNMLFYNRAALEAAGVEPPSSDPNERMTWAELIELAKKVQSAGGAKWGLMFQQIDRYYQLQPLFESSGAGPGLTGDDMLTPTIASDAWIKTAEWYGDLFESGLSPRGVTPAETDTMFGAGEFAFLVGGSWAIPRWASSGLTDFGVAPMPYFEGGEPATPTGAWSWAVNPNSDDAELAHKFLQFAALTPEGSALTVVNFPAPPVNPGGFETFVAKFIDGAPEGSEDVYQALMDITGHELANTAHVRPRSVGYVVFETVMNKAFSDIRNGNDARETLTSAENQLKSSFRRLK